MPPGILPHRNTAVKDILSFEDTLKTRPRNWRKLTNILKTQRETLGSDNLSTIEKGAIARIR